MITKHRTIKKSVVADIPVIMQLLECGRQKMRANGNLEQWTDGNPKQSLIEADIKTSSYFHLFCSRKFAVHMTVLLQRNEKSSKYKLPELSRQELGKPSRRKRN